jgi:hypothetical protein
VGPRDVLDAVVKRKIFSPCRESNPKTLIVQPVAKSKSKQPSGGRSCHLTNRLLKPYSNLESCVQFLRERWIPDLKHSAWHSTKH